MKVFNAALSATEGLGFLDAAFSQPDISCQPQWQLSHLRGLMDCPSPSDGDCPPTKNRNLILSVPSTVDYQASHCPDRPNRF
ncbi:MAG: hypothetical protein NO482_08065 [Candidatus Methanomethylicia archaeon]|nr:hypothetical protein [Candidatus Methanomethylicia archaeon]